MAPLARRFHTSWRAPRHPEPLSLAPLARAWSDSSFSQISSPRHANASSCRCLPRACRCSRTKPTKRRSDAAAWRTVCSCCSFARRRPRVLEPAGRKVEPVRNGLWPSLTEAANSTSCYAAPRARPTGSVTRAPGQSGTAPPTNSTRASCRPSATTPCSARCCAASCATTRPCSPAATRWAARSR